MGNIFVVDSEKEIRYLIRMMLESAEHTVYESPDGETAIDILDICPNPVDMIILNLRMPRMDGFRFLTALQSQASYPPIVVLTSSSHWGPIPEDLGHMISGYLLKPFRRQELFDLVDSLVSQNNNLPAS